MVQWPAKISSMSGLWAALDGEFRAYCYPGTTDLDPVVAKWPPKGPGNKNPGSAFNSNYRPSVRYMDRLVQLEQHKSAGLEMTRVQAAGVVILALDAAMRDSGVTISYFCEGIARLGNPRNTS